MRFTKVRWKNLFSYGDYYSEVDLNQDGLIFVRGVNKDDNTSNGSGKSSICDIFIWTLFGKALKNIPADNVKNYHTKGAGHGIVEFWIGDDYYEVNRYRNDREYKNGVIVKKNGIVDSEFANGTNRDVQKAIDSLLGLDYHSLTSSIIFSSELPFLIPKLTPERRRAHMENVLGMQAYSEYGKVAKARTRALRRLLEDVTIEIREKTNYLKQERNDLIGYKESFKHFKSDNQRLISELKKELKEINHKVKKIDPSKRTTIDEELTTLLQRSSELTDQIREQETELARIESEISLLESKKTSEEKSAEKLIASIHREHTHTIEALNDKIDLMEQECPTCNRGWEEHEVEELKAHYAKKIDEIKQDQDSQIQSEKSALAGSISHIAEQLSKMDVSSLKEGISHLKAELEGNGTQADKLTTKLNALPTQEYVSELERKRQSIQETIDAKQKEVNPYKEVIDNLYIKINDYLEQLEGAEERKQALENKLKYSTFWDESFNNDGLKLFIFESVIPVLNSRLAFYLPMLFDGKPIHISFDQMMNMTVVSNKQMTSYGNLSMGERKRVDLSIALAMLDTAQAQHGIISNCMFFDEIFDSSLDSQGVRTVTEILHSMPVQTIFIMSHRLEVASEFDNVLDVEKRGKLSRILT